MAFFRPLKRARGAPLEKPNVNNRRTGQAIALAAILVQAPRLVLTLLAADRQAVNPAWQRTLLVVAGIGTALVLTGGNLYLAHSVAAATRWRRLLALMWLAVLCASGALTVPMIAGGLSGRSLPQVLAASSLSWSWALLAALAHEVTAAGCILATTAHQPVDVDFKVLPQPAVASAAPAVGSEAASEAQPQGLRLACRKGCGRTFNSLQAELGHLRHCPNGLARKPSPVETVS